jgi:hypothetical protein
MKIKETEQIVVYLSYYELRDLILKNANMYDAAISKDHKVTEKIQVGVKTIDQDVSITVVIEREKLPIPKKRPRCR